MNHNPFDLLPGDIVWLDKGHVNQCKVHVVSMTPLELYSRVHLAENKDASDEDCWNVITSRLTPIEHNQ